MVDIWLMVVVNATTAVACGLAARLYGPPPLLYFVGMGLCAIGAAVAPIVTG